MKRVDWFLLGIAGSAILLVTVALVIAVTTPDPTYESEDTPAGVAHNYLFALRHDDLERAYFYIYPSIKNYPVSSSEFTELAMHNRWILDKDRDGNATLHVESSTIKGDFATVYVREARFFSEGLFNNGQDIHTFRMQLRLTEGEWKLPDSDSYWLHCMHDEDGCRHPVRD